MRTCAVFTCKNKGLHTFPSDELLKHKWIKAARLDVQRKIGWHLRPYSSLCSDHFKPEDFEIRRGRRLLKLSAVPSLFPWTETPLNASSETPVVKASTSQSESTIISVENPGLDPKTPISESTIPLEGEVHEISFNPTNVFRTYSKPHPPMQFVEEHINLSFESSHMDIDPLKLSEDEISDLSPVPDDICAQEVTVEDDSVSEQIMLSSVCDSSTQTMKDIPFSLCKFRNNDKTIHFYTGLETFDKVLFVFDTLEDSSNLNYIYKKPPNKINTLEQFLITLIILRRHKEFEEIAMMYEITIKEVANIFITWVCFMALQWKNIDIWMDRESVKWYMPLDFYDKYPKTRVIIDATECPVKKPGLPLAQQVTFSHYKNRNTVKFLIGIAPSGLITYVSPSYGGSATDRQIIERSSILNRFQYSDEIMVDKGLNVQDIFISHGVRVNIPTFFKKGNQISPETLSKDRKIASKRVHVERIIGMLKTFKILKQPLNLTETLLSSDIVFVCAMLVNFRNNIINKNA